MLKPEGKKWSIKSAPDDYVLNGHFDKVLANLFYNRGFDDLEAVRSFLEPDFKTLPDPFLIPDMAKAVTRLLKAVRAKEKICVYGDYDVDGITSVALISDLLNKIGANFEHYIPSRLTEGYGLQVEAIENLAEKGINLIVTVDCGITAIKEVALASAKGIDVIITDHHEVPAELPQAFAIVHPDAPGSRYPYRNLAGVGVAFKFAQAVLEKASVPKKEEFLKWSLDLVALGTIADLVPLLDENRILAFYGLIVLKKTKRAGLLALYDNAAIEPKDMDSYKVAFQIAPRLNAAGRLAHADESLRLLLVAEPAEARKLATNLSKLNLERQAKTQEILASAFQKIEKLPDDQRFIVLYGTDWSSGIIGIVASKIVENYSRPVILLQESAGQLHGSARSIADLNLYEALFDCQDLLDHFGGHKMAAGLTLKKENLEALTARLDRLCHESLDESSFLPTVEIESLLDFEDINDSLWETVLKFAPYGNGNPWPVFATRGLVARRVKYLGSEGKHLKVLLEDEVGHSFEAIGFGFGEFKLEPGQAVDLAYKLQENEWNGKKSIELRIVDICIKN